MTKYYSSSCQDYYADKVLQLKSGFFLDIGAGTEEGGEVGSNTYYFENIGWKGICLDLEDKRLSKRLCTKLAVEITSTNLNDILNRLNCPVNVDYLSIDVDGLDYEVLDQYLSGGRSFSFLTIEHDIGTLNPGREEVKNKIYSRLMKDNYIRIANNVCNRSVVGNLNIGYPFEDWYVNPSFVNTRNFYNEDR